MDDGRLPSPISRGFSVPLVRDRKLPGRAWTECWIAGGLTMFPGKGVAWWVTAWGANPL
jgi:hypothetical protein